MGRKRRKVDYRQLYKDYFGIEFGPDMVVHHIDFDRNNNNIGNLLLMPRTLHAKYHMHISQLGGANDGFIDCNMQVDTNTYRIAALRGLADSLDEIVEWFKTKHTMELMKLSGVRWDDVVGHK